MAAFTFIEHDPDIESWESVTVDSLFNPAFKSKLTTILTILKIVVRIGVGFQFVVSILRNLSGNLIQESVEFVALERCSGSAFKRFFQRTPPPKSLDHYINKIIQKARF
ncbi:hypothetical protein BLNAU_2387 [Blattamonas nauphoetae]|uniref:Uncharacterized protein n=1 Tax=Blattamonas nauphoetae TaxID=2049346 RepID=A0ABQ9YFW5_9EUKA|nr:hypothetical protein BLNAU_2387 [Blattamonas nauphoetae]